jgi:hypothetical protein
MQAGRHNVDMLQIGAVCDPPAFLQVVLAEVCDESTPADQEGDAAPACGGRNIQAIREGQLLDKRQTIDL